MGSHIRGHRRPSFTLHDRLRHRIRQIERTVGAAISCAEPLRRLETGPEKCIEGHLHRLAGEIADLTGDLAIIAALADRAQQPATRPPRPAKAVA